MRISIIGSAGRNEDADKLNLKVYLKMYHQLKEFIYSIMNANKIQLSDIELISGGSAWADHLAILFFFEHQEVKLILHLPCVFIDTRFERNRYGNVLNELHQQFSQKCEINSLWQIEKAIELGAQVYFHDGFFRRNDLIAKSDFMIAFTFGISQPKPGGTKDTWDKFKSSNKVHFNIAKL